MGSKFYSAAYKILSGILRKIYNIHVHGAENEPLEGAYIASSNHMSNNDVLIVAVSLKRQVRFFAKAELFKIPLLKQLITSLGAFPVERDKADVGSLKKTINILENGEVIGFYPQGKRCPGIHPADTSIKSGIGMIAYRTKAKVLPIIVKTKNFKIRLFKRTDVYIGKPIGYDELEYNNGTRDDYEIASHIIFRRMLDLIM
jgi:1-acyl-sn-glycerol-3-phosphate acyltransferase